MSPLANRFAVPLLMLVAVMAALVAVTPAAAASKEQQLRVQVLTCQDRRTPDLQPHDLTCVRAQAYATKIVGVNQRGDRVTWDIKAPGSVCDKNGSVPNWWWRTADGVEITLSTGQVVKIKQGSSNTYWLNVAVYNTYLNIGGVVSSGYGTSTKTWGSDS